MGQRERPPQSAQECFLPSNGPGLQTPRGVSLPPRPVLALAAFSGSEEAAEQK